MTNVRRSRGIGVVVLIAGALGACTVTENPSASSAAGGGAAGAAGSAVASSGAGGTAGGTTSVAGAGAATTDSGAGGGGAIGAGAGGAIGSNLGPFSCSGKKATSALVTDFSELMPTATDPTAFTFGLGGTFSYPAGAITLANTSGAFTATGRVKDYSGFGLFITGCVDASAYSGVAFTIKGQVGTQNELIFRLQTNATTAIDPPHQKGACLVPAGLMPYQACDAPEAQVVVTPTTAPVELQFGQLTGAKPSGVVNGSDVLGFEFYLPWSTGATPYDFNVTIDDLKFIGVGTDTSGGGSAGSTGSAGSSGAGGGGGSAGSQ